MGFLIVSRMDGSPWFYLVIIFICWEQGAFTVETDPQILSVPSLTNDFASIVYIFVIEGGCRLQYLFNPSKKFSRHLSWKLLIYGLGI